MKRKIKILLSVSILILLAGTGQLYGNKKYPFSTDSTHLTIWNGTEYVPFFMKGVNLGIAVPGTFPGELAAKRKDYAAWFSQITDAGFNCIRLYTLHYPRFYEVLDSFNTANPKHMLHFLQGVWLEEEIPGYDYDLFSLDSAFTQEIKDNIDCVHGNNIIASRLGKAHGTYATDVSKWCMGYIIGREIYPIEVLTTNSNNAGITSHTGNQFSISNATPAESWITGKLDYAMEYEQNEYTTQRPISASSWPTLDPIYHPEEKNRDEDTASIDLSKVELINAPAGLFISYHAYPYYPDFVSDQSSYQNYSDAYGPNSYEGYLTELKSHYQGLPLIIAEYGVPSSWTIAHYSSSGMNHGGFDEYNQGLTNIRLLETIRETNCGGGIQFAWIDEWFKSTWILDPIDYNPESRILWHNIAAAEQNFGLVGFESTLANDTIVNLNANLPITHAIASINYSYLELEIGLKDPLALPGEMWVSIDTYSDSLGELLLPNGDTIPSRSEFLLKITNYSAQLYVTEAYDLFGIWHNISGPNQLYHSIATDGAPWNIVRIRNNSTHSSVQYIGNLNVKYGFQPTFSTDGVIISDNKIKIKLPWSYINVVAPDQMKVFNDNKATTTKEDTVSDGFNISIQYLDEWYSTPNRFSWDPWVSIANTGGIEYLKRSYRVMRDQLTDFNTAAIAVRDTFTFNIPDTVYIVHADTGILANDYDLDGNFMNSLVIQKPRKGQIQLNSDGSFEYYPNPGFSGYDSLTYAIYDGYSLSTFNKVILQIKHPLSSRTKALNNEFEFDIFPNPTSDFLTVNSTSNIDELQIFNLNGKSLYQALSLGNNSQINVTNYPKGTYIILLKSGNKIVAEKFVIQ